jgi:hypothetical protein
MVIAIQSRTPELLFGESTASHVHPAIWIITGLCMLIGAGAVAPCFIGAQALAKRAAVRGNMRTLQIAAESYCQESGHYPADLKELGPFFPGGDNKIGGALGKWPANPCTGRGDAYILDTGIRTRTDITLKRESTPVRSRFERGRVAYSCVAGGRGYAIVGIDNDTLELPGSNGKVFVMFNEIALPTPQPSAKEATRNNSKILVLSCM